MKIPYNNERSLNVFRILVLLYTFKTCSLKGEKNNYFKFGISKLVKLDSFLRESSLFESLIEYKKINSGVNTKKEINEFLNSYSADQNLNYYVDKFWFGPYDLEYEDFLLYMYSKELIEIVIENNGEEIYFIAENAI